MKETNHLFSYEIPLTSGANIESHHIFPFYDSLITGDTLKISITIDGTDPSSIVVSNQDDIDKVIEYNENIDAESETIIKIEIIKNSVNYINIYRLDYFIGYLESLTLSQLLSVFSQYKNSTNKISLNFQEGENFTFSSNLFSTNSSTKEINNLIKQERIENLNLTTNTSGISKFDLIPEDFRVNESSDNLLRLKSIFDKIATFLSIAFISDWSELNNDNLHFKILGYKKIDLILSFQNNTNITKNFFEIYRWIFENGNGSIEDKLGLARNIISRYIKYSNNELFLDEDAYSSIITSYKIYLKENVEKYIETKNRVAELTTELSIRSRDIILLVSSNFKNNNLTLLSFFISLVIFNSLSEDSNATIFNEEKYYISLTFLLISLVYLVTTYRQINKEIKINVRYFFSIKRIYSDLFDRNELNKLFRKKNLKYSINNVRMTANKYFTFWMVEVILLFLLTIGLTYHHEITNFVIKAYSLF